MGTKFAPIYATLTLAYLEISLYSKIKQRFGEDFENQFKKLWKRYLDDCFTIWTESKEKLENIKLILNQLHPAIKFTMESDMKELPFLDILIKNIGGHIGTDIYSKPTDAKQYLLFSSAHPKHTKTNLPFSLARRTCAIVSEKHVLNQRLSELEQTLRKRNYPINIIKNGIEKAKALQKETLRIPKQKRMIKTYRIFLHITNAILKSST